MAERKRNKEIHFYVTEEERKAYPQEDDRIKNQKHGSLSA